MDTFIGLLIGLIGVAIGYIFHLGIKVLIDKLLDKIKGKKS